MKAVALVASEGSARASEARRALRLDPRTKVLMLVCANVTLLCSGFDAAGFVLKFLVAGIVVALLIAAGRRAAGIGFAAVFAAAALLEQMNERGLLDALGSTSAAAVTLRVLSALVLQLMPGTMFAYYLFATTKVSEFVAAMERVRLPQRVIIPFAVVFRFFPTVLEEYRSIRDAMRLRGVGWRSGPVALVEYRLVPLVAGMVKGTSCRRPRSRAAWEARPCGRAAAASGSRRRMRRWRPCSWRARRRRRRRG